MITPAGTRLSRNWTSRLQQWPRLTSLSISSPSWFTRERNWEKLRLELFWSSWKGTVGQWPSFYGTLSSGTEVFALWRVSSTLKMLVRYFQKFKNWLFLVKGWLVMGCIASSGILFEAPGRRLEIAQYVFPRLLEANISFMKKRSYLPKNFFLGSVSTPPLQPKTVF